MLAAAAGDSAPGERDADDADELFVAPTVDCPSLYSSDFDYAHTALQHLKADGVRSSSRPKEQLIELTWTDNLQQRFDKLPTEIRPDDGVVLLTAISLVPYVGKILLFFTMFPCVGAAIGTRFGGATS